MQAISVAPPPRMNAPSCAKCRSAGRVQVAILVRPAPHDQASRQYDPCQAVPVQPDRDVSEDLPKPVPRRNLRATPDTQDQPRDVSGCLEDQASPQRQSGARQPRHHPRGEPPGKGKSEGYPHLRGEPRGRRGLGVFEGGGNPLRGRQDPVRSECIAEPPQRDLVGPLWRFPGRSQGWILAAVRADGRLVRQLLGAVRTHLHACYFRRRVAAAVAVAFARGACECPGQNIEEPKPLVLCRPPQPAGGAVVDLRGEGWQRRTLQQELAAIPVLDGRRRSHGDRHPPSRSSCPARSLRA